PFGFPAPYVDATPPALRRGCTRLLVGPGRGERSTCYGLGQRAPTDYLDPGIRITGWPPDGCRDCPTLEGEPVTLQRLVAAVRRDSPCSAPFLPEPAATPLARRSSCRSRR